MTCSKTSYKLPILQKDPEWMEDKLKREMVQEAISTIDGSSLDDLYKVTPYVLRLTDHHDIEARSTGLICIADLVRKFSVNDLKQANFDGLFFETLKGLLYHDNADLTRGLIPTLLQFIDKLGYGDDEMESVYSSIIGKVRLTTQRELQRTLMEHIVNIGRTIKERLHKFTESLLQLASENLQDDFNRRTVEIMFYTCDLLVLLINVTESESKTFLHPIAALLIKLYTRLEDAKHTSPDFQIDQLRVEVIKVLKNLSFHNPDLMKSMADELKKELPKSSKDYVIVEKIFEEVLSKE